MSDSERQELEDELRILQLIQHTYLEHPQLGRNESERTEHLLDVMERIAEIQSFLNRTDHDEGHTRSAD